MASKRSKLLERVSETRREPRPSRILDAEKPAQKKKGYKIVAISLYTPDLEWTDEVSQKLQRSGVAKANRSLVIREAIYELERAIQGKSNEELVRFFIERQASRAAANNS